MTQELIEQLRAARKSREDFKRAQELSLKAWEAANLDPLVKFCDHTYPWGDSAWRGDYSIPDYKVCQICYKTEHGR